MYEVMVDDGMGNVVRCRFTRPELCSLIGNSILRGVIASQNIEGEDVPPMVLKEPVDLPEALLTSPSIRKLS